MPLRRPKLELAACLIAACTGPPVGERPPEPVVGGTEIEAARGAMPHPEYEVKSRIEPGLEKTAAHAKADLAQRLDIDGQGIEVAEAYAVTWRNSGLGCPEPGMRYTEVLTPGVLIRLRTGGRIYEYHGGRESEPFLCEPAARIEEPLPRDSHDDGT